MIKIDYSQLSTFISCPRKYRNRYILNLRKIKEDERELDLNFGKCFHKGLELLYKGKSLEEAKQSFRTGFTPTEGEKAKTPANGELLVEKYWQYWQNSPSELSNKNLQIIDVEKVVEYPINDDIIWLVKLDTVVKNVGGLWSLEHKTTRSLAYNYFYQFDPNMQISGQCAAIQKVYGQCSGAIIDVSTVGFRQKAYKGLPAGFYSEFTRDIINRNKEQIADFEANVISWVNKLILCEIINDFPKNENCCHQFKGCGFTEMCSNCDDQEIINTLYEKYNPFEYLKEEE